MGKELAEEVVLALQVGWMMSEEEMQWWGGQLSLCGHCCGSGGARPASAFHLFSPPSLPEATKAIPPCR